MLLSNTTHIKTLPTLIFLIFANVWYYENMKKLIMMLKRFFTRSKVDVEAEVEADKK